MGSPDGRGVVLIFAFFEPNPLSHSLHCSLPAHHSHRTCSYCGILGELRARVMWNNAMVWHQGRQRTPPAIITAPSISKHLDSFSMLTRRYALTPSQRASGIHRAELEGLWNIKRLDQDLRAIFLTQMRATVLQHRITTAKAIDALRSHAGPHEELSQTDQCFVLTELLQCNCMQERGLPIRACACLIAS